MKIPMLISVWCLILFFLWYGLAEFVPALKTEMWMKVGAVLALLVAVLTFLGV